MTVLCMVTLGALQYGWFFYCLHTATNAARQGARVACVLGGTKLDGDNAIKAALGGDQGMLYKAATVKGVTFTNDLDGRYCVMGEVVMPYTSIVRLLPVDWLPVPDCRAKVTMAQEGGTVVPPSGG
jgi:hypothetical protein